MAKKYISKIVKGNVDMYVKDSEAREMISQLGGEIASEELCEDAAEEIVFESESV